MKTKKMLSMALVTIFVLSFVAAIPSSLAMEPCARCTWTKEARNYRDNYLKDIMIAMYTLAGTPTDPPYIHYSWLDWVEGLDDLQATVDGAVDYTDCYNWWMYILTVLYNMTVEEANTYISYGHGAAGWPPDPPLTTYVEVSDHDYCFFPAKPVCTDFNVSVIVQDVTDMKGIQIMLGYNASLITAKRIYETDITDDATDWIPVNATEKFNPDRHPTINNTRTYPYQKFLPYQFVWVGAGGFTPFTGTGSVFEIEFHIEVCPPEDTVTEPENRSVSCTLDLFIMYDSEVFHGEVELLDSMYDPIAHAALDGCYANIQPMHVVGYPIARCNVYPSVQYVGKNVTFDGSASDDGGAPPLIYGWDVGSDGIYEIITSSPTASWYCDEPGTYNVTLSVVNDMMLEDTVDEPQYWEVILPLGIIQDLYTSENRFCGQTTDFTGEGLAIDPLELDPRTNPGYVDAVSPDVNITLFVRVTYNGAPRMHVLVAIQIIHEWWEFNQEAGFPEGYELINETYATRTIETDKDGMAVTWFRIPTICEATEFGKWLVVANCKVQEVVTQDWIRFDVGYAVKLLDVATFDFDTGELSDRFGAPCDTIEIGIIGKNIMFMPKWVLIVATVYDDCDVPIGIDWAWTYAEPAELYCHPTQFETWLYVHLPQWTYVGVGKVYVSAFTDWPYPNYGEAYCPEIGTTFFLEWVGP